MAAHFEDSRIVVHKLKCGPYDNNAYLVVCPETGESIVIDAPADPGSLIEAARDTTVKAVVITHSHSDHILGLAEVRSALGAPVGIGEPDAGRGQGGVFIDAADTPVCHIASFEGQMEHAWDLHIIDEGGTTADKALVFQAPHATTDKGRGGLSGHGGSSGRKISEKSRQ